MPPALSVGEHSANVTAAPSAATASVQVIAGQYPSAVLAIRQAPRFIDACHS